MGTINPRTLLMLSTVVGLFVLSCSEKSTEPQEISLKQAEQIVLASILNNNDSGKVVYELPTKLKSGAVVIQRGPDTTKYKAPNDSWFFFIDDQPGYRWTHPCRYAFVACADGKHTVFNEGFPPDNFDSLRVVSFR